MGKFKSVWCLHITGAKFEWHHLNISRDIIDFVIYLLTSTTDDVIIFKEKLYYLGNLKQDLPKKKCLSYSL